MSNDLLADRYKLMERIAESSSAAVYKAFDETLGRSVAVKLISPRYAQTPSFATEFKNAAQAAASISNPYVVNLYDYGHSDKGYYLVMEYVAGTDMKRAIQARGPIEQHRAAQIASQVLEALTAAHAYNIVHGAISSKNIMVQPDGNVKVMDFGVPRINTIDLSQEESSFADVKYLSPEQIRGRRPSPASDIYSLGIVLYEVLTGRLPFDGSDTATIALEQLKEQPTRPSVIDMTIDPRLDDCIMTALEKDPAARFASAREMRGALASFLAGEVPMRDISMDETSMMGTNVMAGVAGTGSAYIADKTQVYNPTGTVMGVEGADRTTQNGRQTPQRPKKKKKWPIVLAIILVLAAAGSFVGFNYYKSLVVVPSAAGLAQADAEATITAAGFKVGTVKQEASSTVAAGNVISQSPAGKAKAAAGSAINFIVSTGPSAADKVAVPDLSGMTASQAESAISAAGLVAKVGNSEYSSVEAGLVYTQNPAAGTQLAKGSAVTYAISLGKQNATVPDVTGSTQASATAALKSAGLAVAVSDDYSSTVASGNVISQNPSAGTSVAAGTTVGIVVSKGAKPVSQVTVPNFLGLSEDSARASAKSAGLSLDITYITDASAKAVVTDQDPESGSKVDPGSIIAVVIVKNS